MQLKMRYKSLDHLKANADLKIPKSTTYEKCLLALTQVGRHSRVQGNAEDFEQEFFYLHRYFILLKYFQTKKDIDKTAEKKKKPNELTQVNEYIRRYEKLQEILTEKYNAAEKSVNSQASQSQILAPSSAVTNKPSSTNDAGWSLKTCQESGSIKCNQLYLLCTNRSSKELIILFDVRRLEDFAASHVKFDNVANIPEEILVPGLSAENLGKKLTGPAAELWSKRGLADALILLDWSSTSKSTERIAKIFVLHNIIKLWDPFTSYKSPPMILEGGFEEVLERYPQIVTDPQVKVPQRREIVTDSPLVPNVNIVYPLDVLEPERPKTSVATHPAVVEVSQSAPRSAPAIIDRTTKPQVQPKEKDDQAAYLPEAMAADSTSEDDDIEPMELDSIQLSAGDGPVTIESFDNSIPPPLANSTSIVDKSTIDKTRIDDSQPETPVLRKPGPAEVENLRKLKPASAPRHSSSQPTESNDISHVPLKKDSTSNGSILRRTSSFPNISQMMDDAPTFSRSLKHVSPKKQSFIYSESDFNRSDATYGKTTPGLIGLKNFANNCYMNSIIQCLNNTEPLVKELVHFDSGRRQFNHTSRLKGRIAQEVIAAFRNMWSGQVKIYSIRELKSLMGEVKDIFKGSMHQDSNEFLIILLEHLHEDLNMPAEVTTLDGAIEETGEKAWGEFRRKNCSIIQRLFYGQHKSTVTCDECGHESATFEQFFNLFVPIPSQRNAVTLHDCIKSYMAGERISGWICPNCKTERNATKKFDISRLPPVLVIALKRFAQEDESWLHKKENLVSYPLENLDMIPFTVRGSEQRCRVYNLYAMSTHSGTTQSGHYRAICKSPGDNRWYMFDDQTVNPLSESSVKSNPEVYILFYIAQNTLS